MAGEMTTAEMVEQCGKWAGFADKINAADMASVHRAIAARLSALDKVARAAAAVSDNGMYDRQPNPNMDADVIVDGPVMDALDAALKEAGYGK